MKRHQGRTPEEIAQLVAEYRSSDLTQEQFAAQAGVPLSKLRFWMYRRKPAAKSNAFVEVEVSPKPSTVGRHYRVDFPGGISLSFSGPVRREELEQLCQLLGK